MRLQKGKYGCSFLEGPPVVMGHHDTMLLHINTVLILMASFYRVGKIVPPLMIQVRRDSAQKYDPNKEELYFFLVLIIAVAYSTLDDPLCVNG